MCFHINIYTVWVFLGFFVRWKMLCLSLTNERKRGMLAYKRGLCVCVIHSSHTIQHCWPQRDLLMHRSTQTKKQLFVVCPASLWLFVCFFSYVGKVILWQKIINKGTVVVLLINFAMLQVYCSKCIVVCCEMLDYAFIKCPV